MRGDDLGRIVVGEPYAPGVDYEGADRFELRYVSGRVLLQILIPNPSRENVRAFQERQIYIGLHAKAATLFFLFKIDGLYDWSDQAFSVNLIPPEDRGVPEFELGLRQLMGFVLVDSITGIVRGIRAATWSPHMTEMFFKLVRRQISEGLTAEQHQENIAAAYVQHQDSRSLARAALIREKAGSKSS